MKRVRSLIQPFWARGIYSPPVVRAAMRGDQRRSLIFLLAIVALLFQSVITGSHVHPGALSERAAAPGIAVAATFSHSAPTKSGECIICREIAQAGQYVASAPPHFEIGALPGFWLSPPVARPGARHSISHAWQSRGPPQVAPF